MFVLTDCSLTTEFVITECSLITKFVMTDLLLLFSLLPSSFKLKVEVAKSIYFNKRSHSNVRFVESIGCKNKQNRLLQILGTLKSQFLQLVYTLYKRTSIWLMALQTSFCFKDFVKLYFVNFHNCCLVWRSN